MWMNEYEIDDAAHRFRNHPILGPATQTLSNFRHVINRNSDGWPYWTAGSNAAKKLEALIQGDRSWEARHGDRVDVTAEQVKAAYRPIKSLCTKHKFTCEFVEPVASEHARKIQAAESDLALLTEAKSETEAKLGVLTSAVESAAARLQLLKEGAEIA